MHPNYHFPIQPSLRHIKMHLEADKYDWTNFKIAEILRACIDSGPDEIGVITPDEGRLKGSMSYALGKMNQLMSLIKAIGAFNNWGSYKCTAE